MGKRLSVATTLSCALHVIVIALALFFDSSPLSKKAEKKALVVQTIALGSPTSTKPANAIAALPPATPATAPAAAPVAPPAAAVTPPAAAVTPPAAAPAAVEPEPAIIEEVEEEAIEEEAIKDEPQPEPVAPEKKKEKPESKKKEKSPPKKADKKPEPKKPEPKPVSAKEDKKKETPQKSKEVAVAEKKESKKADKKPEKKAKKEEKKAPKKPDPQVAKKEAAAKKAKENKLKEEARKKELLAKAKESIEKINSANHKMTPKESGKSASGKKEADSASKIPQALGKLNTETPGFGSPVGSLNAEQAASHDMAYGGLIASMLKSNLKLPEYGEVKVRLHIARNGAVSRVEIISSRSEKNKQYVESELLKMRFPPFGSHFVGMETRTFPITLSNDL